MLEMTSMAG